MPTPLVSPTATTFAALGVPARLEAVLARQGILAPFPIQSATLTDTLQGRDVLGRGRTGSGKTLAFSLPLVTRLDATKRSGKAPRGLILVPTRELANQVLAVIAPLAVAGGLRAITLFGGVGQKPQVDALQRGVDILIACPGRLTDLLQQGYVDLSQVEITILDEADHMADMGFLPVVTRILDKTPHTSQRLLFSATLDNGVDVLVKRYLKDPRTHSVDSASSPVTAMEHHVFEVSGENKQEVVSALAGRKGRTVLFTRTKHQAKKLARVLSKEGINAVELHGNLSQNARERNLSAFSSGESGVLVATDIAARGIHVDSVSLVVHVDPPVDHKAYLHRSGRTARAGAAGAVVTLMLPEQRRDVDLLTRQASITAARTKVTLHSPELTLLVGEKADLVVVPVVPPLAVPRTAQRRVAPVAARTAQKRPERTIPLQQPERRRRTRQGAKSSPVAAPAPISYTTSSWKTP